MNIGLAALFSDMFSQTSFIVASRLKFLVASEGDAIWPI